MASTTLQFIELIDLAVGVPNASAINVNVLHSVLQLLATQVGIHKHNIEFEGEDSKKIQTLKDRTPTPVIDLVNYRFADQDTLQRDSAMASKKHIHSEARNPVKMVEFRRLENKVRMMATHVEAITMLPATEELLEIMRNNPDCKPVSEMVHSLTLTKRVSAVEESVDKFASILERVYKDQNRIRRAFRTQFPDINIDSSDIEMPLTQIPDKRSSGQSQSQSQSLPTDPSGMPIDIEELDSSPELKYFLMFIKSKLDQLEASIENQGKDRREGKPGEDVKHSLNPSDYMTGTSVSESPQNKRIFFIEKVCQSNESKIRVVEQTIRTEFQAMQDRVKWMETELNNWTEKFGENFGEEVSGIGKRLSGISGIREGPVMLEVTNTITLLQQEVSEMAAGLQNLVTDHEKKNEILRKLKLTVEKMENTKLDRDALDDSLSGKADTSMVNRKVSYEQFDLTCSEFNSTLNNTMKRISDQESEWGTVITELHEAVKNKLDRNEISPLKEFINYRLKILQDKLKTILAEKMESEGAGTKKQLIKDLRCISCDKAVSQRVDKAPFKGIDEFPLSKSVKPYLTYELDQIRRQEKQLPLSQNLNEFHKVLKEAAKNRLKRKDETGDKPDHLCNRYCGGSHTQTSAVQRVAKAGHFTEKWGLHVLPYAHKTESPKDKKRSSDTQRASNVPFLREVAHADEQNVQDEKTS